MNAKILPTPNSRDDFFVFETLNNAIIPAVGAEAKPNALAIKIPKTTEITVFIVRNPIFNPKTPFHFFNFSLD